jgi:hypothetical protein
MSTKLVKILSVSTLGTTGRRLQLTNLDTNGSLQQQTVEESHTPY